GVKAVKALRGGRRGEGVRGGVVGEPRGDGGEVLLLHRQDLAVGAAGDQAVVDDSSWRVGGEKGRAIHADGDGVGAGVVLPRPSNHGDRSCWLAMSQRLSELEPSVTYRTLRVES